jgi:serine/threonine-protein kinase
VANGLTNLSEREEQFGEIAFAYLRAREEGQRPNPREWLARYPGFVSELADFIADQEEVDRLGAPLRQIIWGEAHPCTEGRGATATANDATQPSAAPRSFGDYEVLEDLARGGMGVVYRARQRCLNRLVALKVIRAGEWASAEEVRRFRNEAETVALLDHPHVVPVYEVGEQAGHLYFSMKLVEGGSLAQHLDRYRDDPKAAARLLATVARAVHHAHQRGVLHRDLKPSNVLLDEQCQPHVTDFGLARRVEADSSLTQSGAIVGTPSYLAPEQTTGQKGAMTTATDVYGLGAVLYALLTGRPPFQAENVLETLVQVREREPQPPRTANRRVDRDLETICLKCLAKEPQRRYASALALAEDLDRFLAGKPIQARPVGPWERGIKWARRRPLAVAVGGLVLAVLLLGGAILVREAWQRAAVERAVETALECADLLREQERYQEALEILTVAEGQLEGRQLGALRERIRLRKRDVDVLMRLEEARLHPSAGSKEGFDFAGADRVYSEAFTWYGLDVTAQDPEEAARRVRASAVCTRLIAALDNWAFMRDKLREGGGARLRVVADLADDDSWRRQMRGAAGRRDRAALERLAEEGALRQPPTNLVLLAGALRVAKGGESAERLLRRAQAKHPEDFWINFTLAATLAAKARSDPAERARFLQTALALRPHSPAAYINLGNALKDQGKFAEAEAKYRRAIELRPDFAAAYANLGIALDDQGKPVEAEAAYRRAIELKPDYAVAYYNLGIGLQDQGKSAEAEAVYRKALQLKPDAPQVHTHLGVALRSQRKLTEAEAAHRKAIELKPDYADAHSNLGAVLSDQGKLPDAVAAYRKAIELQPNDATANYNLASTLQKQHKLAEAVVACQKAIAIRPRWALAFNKLGLIHQDQRKFPEAEAAFRKAIAHKADFAMAYNNLGTVLIDQRKSEEAVAAFRKAVELDRHNRTPQRNLVNALKMRGESAATVVEAFRKLTGSLPDDAEVHYNAGVDLQKEGKLEAAMASYRRAIALKPDYPEALCNLGLVLNRQGRFMKGLAPLRRGHELGSQRPNWSYPSAKWVHETERLVTLDAKLPKVLAGELQPADAAERIALAELCREYKKRYAAAARLYAEAFAEQSKFAENVNLTHCFDAAAAAALAGCGQGEDAAQLDEKERARLRKQAHDLLRARLEKFKQLAEKGPAENHAAISRRLQNWEKVNVFAGVREAGSLARLPETERGDWQQLWEEVATLRQRTQPKKK